MRKYVILVLIGILTIVFLLPIKDVYAIDSFLQIQKTELTKEEKIKLDIDLNKIKYTKFKIEIISDMLIEDITMDNKNIEIEKNNNDEIYIEIDKEKVLLDKITLEFSVPEEIQIGTKITFVVNITDLNNEKNILVQQAEITIANNKSEENNITENDKINKQENKNNQEEKSENDKVENKEMESKMDLNSTSNKENIKEETQVNIKVMNVQNATANTGTNIDSVKYNGSNNNYLSNLYIEDFELNKDFKKDNNTYFVNVNKNISIINIIAQKEDDTANVCIYGNDQLKDGTNKVLINVTAENGNIRTYRIYVIIKT